MTCGGLRVSFLYSYRWHIDGAPSDIWTGSKVSWFFFGRTVDHSRELASPRRQSQKSFLEDPDEHFQGHDKVDLEDLKFLGLAPGY